MNHKKIIATTILVIFCVSFFLWYQYDNRTHKDLMTDSRELLQTMESKQKKSKRKTKTNITTQTEIKQENRAENTTQKAEKPNNETINLKTDISTDEQKHPVSVDVEPEDAGIADESPYGFGAYPEVPHDYIERHGQPVWNRQHAKNLPDSTLRELELINRVKIQKWIDGDHKFTSGVYENGKVYLNYPNTFYVTYTNKILPDGTHFRYISSVLSGQELPLTPEQIFAGEIPKGVNLIDIENEDAGIKPLSFLELN